MQQKQRRFLKVGGAAIAALLLLALVAVGVVYANANSSALAIDQPPVPDPPLAAIGNGAVELANPLRAKRGPQGESTIYYDDLTVQSGELYSTDIIVYSGDVIVEEAGEIRGSLVVYSGDIVVEEGATIGGDVIAMSGDAYIAGQVNGAVVVWSGDITLAAQATIAGDVSVMSGEIHRESSATVSGNLLVGPKLPPMPPLPPLLTELGLDLPGQSTIVEAIPPTITPTRWNKFSLLLLRLVGSTLLTAFIVLATGLVYYLQPALIDRLRVTLTKQRATNFIVGFLLNLLLLFLMMLAWRSSSVLIALCLAPLSLVATLLFFVLNMGGWAALSLIVGERLLAYTKLTPHAYTALIIGATVMTGAITFVWSLGGCMRPLAYLVLLTLTALGNGSLIMQQLNKRGDSQEITV